MLWEDRFRKLDHLTRSIKDDLSAEDRQVASRVVQNLLRGRCEQVAAKNTATSAKPGNE